MAPSALATLNRPGSAAAASADTPPGPMTRNVLPSAPVRMSAARQSASGRPSAENVVTGIWAGPASWRPRGSSRFTTPAVGVPGGEQLGLGREVVVDAVVEVEVILGQVGEDGHVVAGAGDPPEGQRVAGHLHRGGPRPGAGPSPPAAPAGRWPRAWSAGWPRPRRRSGSARRRSGRPGSPRPAARTPAGRSWSSCRWSRSPRSAAAARTGSRRSRRRPRPSRARGSATTKAGSPDPRPPRPGPAGSVSTAAAPAAAASGQNRAPWNRLPGSAAYRSPGRTSRESCVMPVTPVGPAEAGERVQGVLAGGLQPEQHREPGERAHGHPFRAQIGWHWQRVPPITAP